MINYAKEEIAPNPTAPAPGQYVIYESLDGGHTPSINIGIITDNSYGETSYIICDSYVRVYSTTTRILLALTQEKIQA